MNGDEEWCVHKLERIDAQKHQLYIRIIFRIAELKIS